jgi:hypothetical protein
VTNTGPVPFRHGTQIALPNDTIWLEGNGEEMSFTFEPAMDQADYHLLWDAYNWSPATIHVGPKYGETTNVNVGLTSVGKQDVQLALANSNPSEVTVTLRGTNKTLSNGKWERDAPWTQTIALGKSGAGGSASTNISIPWTVARGGVTATWTTGEAGKSEKTTPIGFAYPGATAQLVCQQPISIQNDSDIPLKIGLAPDRLDHTIAPYGSWPFEPGEGTATVWYAPGIDPGKWRAWGVTNGKPLSKTIPDERSVRILLEPDERYIREKVEYIQDMVDDIPSSTSQGATWFWDATSDLKALKECGLTTQSVPNVAWPDFNTLKSALREWEVWDAHNLLGNATSWDEYMALPVEKWY